MQVRQQASNAKRLPLLALLDKDLHYIPRTDNLLLDNIIYQLVRLPPNTTHTKTMKNYNHGIFLIVSTIYMIAIQPSNGFTFLSNSKRMSPTTTILLSHNPNKFQKDTNKNDSIKKSQSPLLENNNVHAVLPTAQQFQKVITSTFIITTLIFSNTFGTSLFENNYNAYAAESKEPIIWKSGKTPIVPGKKPKDKNDTSGTRKDGDFLRSISNCKVRALFFFAYLLI